MSQKFDVGDEVEFYFSLRTCWMPGRVADTTRDFAGMRGLVYRCETPDFPASGCSAWVKAKNIRLARASDSTIALDDLSAKQRDAWKRAVAKKADAP